MARIKSIYGNKNIFAAKIIVLKDKRLQESHFWGVRSIFGLRREIRACGAENFKVSVSLTVRHCLTNINLLRFCPDNVKVIFKLAKLFSENSCKEIRYFVKLPATVTATPPVTPLVPVS